MPTTKLQLAGDAGITIDAIIRNNGQPWNGTQFVDYDGADYADYVIPLAEQSTIGFYSANFPTGIISAGVYHVTYLQRTDPMTPSPSDAIIYQSLFSWNGTQEGPPIPFVPSTAPTVAEFKEFFDRDFDYGLGFDKVRDSDISKALAMVAPVFNDCLWEDTERGTVYLFEAAHFLFMNITAAGGLKQQGQGKGLKAVGGGVILSKGVGSVNVAYSPCQEILDDRLLSQFMRSTYGQIFLQMIEPRLVGNAAVVSGRGYNPFFSNRVNDIVF